MQFADFELVTKAKQGDVVAFSKLYDMYYSAIFGYILRRTGDVYAAADITSETFMKMLKKITTFSYQDIPFSAWLYRVATNEIANHYRQKKTYSLESLREKTGFEIAAATDMEEEFTQAQEIFEKEKRFMTVLHHLKTMPLAYQEVIALRFFEKKKTREIADILGKSEGTIKSLLSRGP